MKTILTVYQVAIKQTASEDDPNGLFTIRVFGSLTQAINEANEWLGQTPVSVKPFGHGFELSVTDRDAVEHAEGGVNYITITPQEIEVNRDDLKTVYEQSK